MRKLRAFTMFSLNRAPSIGSVHASSVARCTVYQKGVHGSTFVAWLVDWVCTFSTAAQRSTTTMTIPAQDRSDIALREADIDNHRLTALILLFTHVFQLGPSATG